MFRGPTVKFSRSCSWPFCGAKTGDKIPECFDYSSYEHLRHYPVACTEGKNAAIDFFIYLLARKNCFALGIPE